MIFEVLLILVSVSNRAVTNIYNSCVRQQWPGGLGSACDPGDPSFDPQTMLFAVVSLSKELYLHCSSQPSCINWVM